jgi:hypothetical protein
LRGAASTTSGQKEGFIDGVERLAANSRPVDLNEGGSLIHGYAGSAF